MNLQNLAALATLSTVVMAGCSGASEEPDDLIALAKAATDSYE